MPSPHPPQSDKSEEDWWTSSDEEDEEEEAEKTIIDLLSRSPSPAPSSSSNNGMSPISPPAGSRASSPAARTPSPGVVSEDQVVASSRGSSPTYIYTESPPRDMGDGMTPRTPSPTNRGGAAATGAAASGAAASGAAAAGARPESGGVWRPRESSTDFLGGEVEVRESSTDWFRRRERNRNTDSPEPSGRDDLTREERKRRREEAAEREEALKRRREEERGDVGGMTYSDVLAMGGQGGKRRSGGDKGKGKKKVEVEEEKGPGGEGVRVGESSTSVPPRGGGGSQRGWGFGSNGQPWAYDVIAHLLDENKGLREENERMRRELEEAREREAPLREAPHPREHPLVRGLGDAMGRVIRTTLQTILPISVCPITMDQIKDPAALNGNVYESKSIHQWAAIRGKDPLTRGDIYEGQIQKLSRMREFMEAMGPMEEAVEALVVFYISTGVDEGERERRKAEVRGWRGMERR